MFQKSSRLRKTWVIEYGEEKPAGHGTACWSQGRGAGSAHWATGTHNFYFATITTGI